MPRDNQSIHGPLKGNPLAGDKSNYWSDPHRAISTYNKISLAGEKGLPIRSFKRTKKSSIIQAIDSIHYLTMLENHIKVDTVAGGNGETAFNALVDMMFNLGYQNAHKKDLVAANLTAYKAICCDTFQICYEILLRKTLRSLTNSLTESSTTSSSKGVVQPWDTDDWDFFINRLGNYGPIPHWIYTLANQLFSKFIKISDSYTQYKNVFPPSYGMMFQPIYDLAEMIAIRNALKPQRVAALTLMDKFGIPYDKGINHEILNPVQVSVEDKDIRALFNHNCNVEYGYDAGAPERLHPSGNFNDDQLTAYTYRKYYFDDPKPESMIHALAPLLGQYSAVNNEFGIIENFAWAAAPDGEWNALVAAENDLVFTQADLNSRHGSWMFLHHLAIWQDADNIQFDATKYRIAIVGDATGVDHYEELFNMCWPYSLRDTNLMYGTGVTYDEARANLMNYLLSIQYGKSTNKKGGKRAARGRSNDDE